MSRVGKKKIIIPEGVDVQVSGPDVEIKNQKEQISYHLPEGISAQISNNEMHIARNADTKSLRSLHGTTTRVISNKITGLSEGFKKILEYKGVGFTVVVEGSNLVMRLGFSHPVAIAIPASLTVSVVKNKIIIEGLDIESVGEFAAKVRELKKPEVYKGKGIKYLGEFIKKKAGKAAQTTTGV